MESMNALIIPLHGLLHQPSHASLHHPAMRGDLARVRELAQEDPARVHATDPFMRTPLITAARGGHVNVVQYLLQHGADIHHVDEGGSTALLEACFKGRGEAVALLLEKGADASVVSRTGETVLMSAAMSRDVGPLEVVLRHAVYDVDAVDEEGRTALHGACRHGRVAAVRMLLEAGADAMIRGHDGRTPADDAVDSGHHACAAALQVRRNRIYVVAMLSRLCVSGRSWLSVAFPSNNLAGLHWCFTEEKCH